MVFCDFFLVGCTPLRENEGRVLKTRGFLRFWGSRNCPENCAHDLFCLIYIYGRFFERGKMSENRQKTSKTGGFWRFFRVRSNPLRESGYQVLKTGFFLRFFFGRVHPSQGKQESSAKNCFFFAFLGVPKLFWKLCLRFVLPYTAVFLTPSQGGFRLV